MCNIKKIGHYLINRIIDNWFLAEPVLFSVYCTHEIMENSKLTIPFRVGKKKIEYCSQILESLTYSMIEEYLKIEIFRILLKHPYQRQPPFPNLMVLALASNITITDVYPTSLALRGVGLWPLPGHLSFEEYYAKVFAILCTPSDMTQTQLEDDIINSMLEQHDTEFCDTEGNQPRNNKQKLEQEELWNSEDSSQISELWEENKELEHEINQVIKMAIDTDAWGTIRGSLKEEISASLIIEMDYKNILNNFRASVISTKRSLTRMRPNRRFGFFQMGSRYELTTNLLIAVDVSGSITNKSLVYFFSVINRFFKYGIEKIDVIQFDTELKNLKPMSLKKATKNIQIYGRGGTNFQPVADFYCSHPEYDGLIYFTDGEAPIPEFNTKKIIHVLWILNTKDNYTLNNNWIKELKGNRATFISLPE